MRESFKHFVIISLIICYFILYEKYDKIIDVFIVFKQFSHRKRAQNYSTVRSRAQLGCYGLEERLSLNDILFKVRNDIISRKHSEKNFSLFFSSLRIKQ